MRNTVPKRLWRGNGEMREGLGSRRKLGELAGKTNSPSWRRLTTTFIGKHETTTCI